MQESFYALGTINSITAYGENAENAVLQAKERVCLLESKMSAFLNNSEISAVSSSAGARRVQVSHEVFNVLSCAKRMSELSNGAFDITIRPLTHLWSIGKNGDTLPNANEISAALRIVNYRHLALNRLTKTAFLKHKNQSIDLGGIAKGYAADEVKRILLANGVTSAMINLGGNIVALGQHPKGGLWRIGIQNPLKERGEFIATVSIENKTVVTSAVNERFFIRDCVRYHHILDPRTGYPARSGLLSVTVICENSVYADALSTAAFVLGFEKGVDLIKSQKADAVFILENGDVFSTFELNNETEDLS